jgi:hypothetical protein
MTDLDLLDAAVRIVKRDGPWYVRRGSDTGRASKSFVDLYGGVTWTFDDIVVHSDTINAITGAYLNHRPLW